MDSYLNQVLLFKNGRKYSFHSGKTITGWLRQSYTARITDSEADEQDIETSLTARRRTAGITRRMWMICSPATVASEDPESQLKCIHKMRVMMPCCCPPKLQRIYTPLAVLVVAINDHNGRYTSTFLLQIVSIDIP
jgi:hypothetical protein